MRVRVLSAPHTHTHREAHTHTLNDDDVLCEM